MSGKSRSAVIWVSILSLVFLFACSSDDGESLRISDTSDGDIEEEADDSTETPEAEADAATDGDEDTLEEEGEQTEQVEDETPKPRFPACDESASTQKLSFVHTNDVHASFAPTRTSEGISPLSRIKAYYNKVKAESPYTLLTDGGDFHEKGSVAELLSEGYATIRAMQAMKYDAAVIGNHDFAWGEEELLAFSQAPETIVLASNTEYTGENPSDFWAVDFATMEVGCLTLGFFGMVSKPWNEKNQQYDGDFFPGGNFHTTYDYTEIAQRIVDEHREEVDIMIFVSHLGRGEDNAIAGAVDGIDIVLGGHSHSSINPPDMVGDTIIIQASSNAEFFAHLDVIVDLETKAVSVDNYEFQTNLPYLFPDYDEEVQLEIEAIMAEYAPEALDEIGFVKRNCDERFIAELTSKAAIAVHDADAALVIIDEIWKSWMRGGLSQQDFLDTYKVERQPAGTPGFNGFYLVEVTGATLSALAEGMDEADYGWVFPETLEETTSYKLAVQKMVAFNPGDYLPGEVEFGEPEFLAETWEILDNYARNRTGQCLYMDQDIALDDCEKR